LGLIWLIAECWPLSALCQRSGCFTPWCVTYYIAFCSLVSRV